MIWKTIPEAPAYAVSSEGQVKRVLSSKFGKPIGAMMTPTWFGRYLRVTLVVDGKRYRPAVHLLVARAFISNPDNLPQVNHVNGNRAICRATNLEWTTPKGNVKHAWALGLCKAQRGSKHGRAILNTKIVKTIRNLLDSGKRPSYIANKFDVARQTVENIRDGRRWKHVQ